VTLSLDSRYVGRTLLRLHNRINQHIPKSICNNQKPTKILPKRNCKKSSIQPSLRIVTQKLDNIFSEMNSARTITMTNNVLRSAFHCAFHHFISSHAHFIIHHVHFIIQHWKPLSFKNPKTNSMPPERIRLFFTSFQLVITSQNNANSIAIFRYNAALSTSYNTMLSLQPVYIDFFVTLHRALNQLVALITL